jgi:uncharacterized protein
MITNFIYPLFLLILLASSCDRNPTAKNDREIDLAKKYGADERGMKRYVMAFLMRGPNRDQDSATSADLQKAHLENINRLAQEGKLILAGPFLDDGEIRGIFIFDLESVEEARALTETDPAIQAGRLVMELHPWYGSAAIMEVNELHNKILEQKQSPE